MNDNDIKVFIGSPVEDPGERRFIHQLRRDLVRVGVRAVLFVNFVTAGRSQRQIDLLALTSERFAHIEIKCLDQTLPVVGSVNGEWVQVLPDGTRKSLGKNCYSQAIEGTYAISDQMRHLAKVGELPRAERHFEHIDTVVCLYPDIPEGSDLSRRDHVTALGYGDLLERIATAGPTPRWHESHRDAFIRHLNLYEEPAAEPAADTWRRLAVETLGEYRRRARGSFAARAGVFVDLTWELDGKTCGLAAVQDRLRSGRGVVLVAPSGYGKTAAAAAIATKLTDQGELVLWLRADEYERGRLSTLLARGGAPFSTTRSVELAQSAIAVGVGVVVVVDGVNECSPRDQAELLEQLVALRLRYRCGILVTSTTAHDAPEGLDAVRARLQPPTDEQRQAILRAHGAKAPGRIPTSFTTPHELALAAACESQLAADSTVAHLHDAYVRACAPEEAVREGLRAVAALVHERLRSSIPLLDASALLRGRSHRRFGSELIDQVLSNRLLDITPGRVRFRHDLLRDFLVAEELVRTCNGAEHLAQTLQQPLHRGLARHAVAIEYDVQRALLVLDILADDDLYLRAIIGEFGTEVAAKLRRSIEELLAIAASPARLRTSTFERSDFGDRWVAAEGWSPGQIAQLTAAGLALRSGHFVDEIAKLLDQTDLRISEAIGLLSADGHRAPTSAAIAATFAPGRTDANSLGATLVALGSEHLGPHALSRSNSPGIAGKLLTVPNPGWGRCYLAASTFNGASRSDVASLPHLVRQAIRLGGYHLELHALWAVSSCGRRLDVGTREAVLMALDAFNPTNWALSSTLVEALASLGVVEPLHSLDDIIGQIRYVLSHKDHPEAAAIASGIVASQFEDDDVVGPFCEAVDSLDSLDRLRLILLACAHAEPSFAADWRMRQLAEAAPCGDPSLDEELRELFQAHAACPRRDGPMLQENVAVFLRAIEGLARLHGPLPPATTELGDDELAWRLLASLLLDDRLGSKPSSELWADLTRVLPGAAVDALFWIATSDFSSEFSGNASVQQRLLEAHPAEVRILLEWSLEHDDQVTSLFRWNRADERKAYVIRTLGDVGDYGTAARLHALTLDPTFGEVAVLAIRAINARL